MSDYVKALPVTLITAEYPALTGAAVWYWTQKAR
jgi:glucokinase